MYGQELATSISPYTHTTSTRGVHSSERGLCDTAFSAKGNYPITSKGGMEIRKGSFFGEILYV